jgi:hypothetical protein
LGRVFVLSVGFGNLRKCVNAPAAFIAHAGCNFMRVMMSYSGV